MSIMSFAGMGFKPGVSQYDTAEGVICRLSLKKRRAAAQAEIDAVQKLKEEKEREEEARQKAMMQRVQQVLLSYSVTICLLARD